MTVIYERISPRKKTVYFLTIFVLFKITLFAIICIFRFWVVFFFYVYLFNVLKLITVFQEFTQFKLCYSSWLFVPMLKCNVTLYCVKLIDDHRSKTIQINHKFLVKTELQTLTAKSNKNISSHEFDTYYKSIYKNNCVCMFVHN